MEVKGLSFQTLIVNYVYTCNISVSVENAKEVFSACQMLNLQSLFNTCENQLIGLINPQNCIGFHKVAALHTVTSLQKKAEKVMLNKLGDFVASQEFKEMEAAEVIKHIQDAALKVGDEWV